MRELYQVAEPQAGYFTARQAADVGVSRRALHSRARKGDVERVRYGIYRLRDFPGHPFEDIVAACLWVGPDSAASHETALVVHGMTDSMPATTHITVPRTFRGSQPGVVVHRASLGEAEREVENSVPVTTIARTVRDVATAGDPALVRQALEQGIERDVISQRQLRRLVRDVPEIAPLVIDVLSEDPT